MFDNDDTKPAVKYLRLIASICTMTLGSTYLVYSFLRTEFVLAYDFAASTRTSFAEIQKLGEKLDILAYNNTLGNLRLRHQYLEDRIFEIELAYPDTSEASALLKRYRREQLDVQQELQEVKKKIDDLKIADSHS